MPFSRINGAAQFAGSVLQLAFQMERNSLGKRFTDSLFLARCVRSRLDFAIRARGSIRFHRADIPLIHVLLLSHFIPLPAESLKTSSAGMPRRTVVPAFPFFYRHCGRH